MGNAVLRATIFVDFVHLLETTVFRHSSIDLVRLGKDPCLHLNSDRLCHRMIVDPSIVVKT